MRKILQKILKMLSVSVLKKYKPKIIAITGSVGKTSTKEAIFAVVSKQYKTRKNLRNYNNEIGVPLTILGFETAGKNIFSWVAIFFKAALMILKRQTNYPEILVLEFGADRPGDIKYLTDFVKPDIAVVTAIGEIPAHVEFFAGPEDIAKEKAILVKSLAPGGFAVLNYDDDTVLDMAHQTNAKTLTFGFGEGSKILASSLNYQNFNEEGGVNFKLHYQKQEFNVNLPKILGKQQAYSALAAITVGAAMGMDLTNILSALRNFKALPGRMKLIKGIKNTWLIDDSYNAAPLSVHAALDVLNQLKAPRKIAVLGDMKEIGKYAFEAHQAVADRAADVVDILITVGDKAKIIAEHVENLGLDSNKVFWFDIDSVAKAGLKLQEILKEGDLVLVKASRAIALERIIKEVMLHPEKAKELLVY